MVQSLNRAFDILEALKKSPHPSSIAEISAKVELSPSTVHRILQTFVENNYVYKDAATHLYTLGPALISLGTAAAHTLKLKSIASPFVRKLSQISREDAFLVIRVGFSGVILERVEGPNNLKIVERYGTEFPLHCGAIRKTLLAHQSKQFQQDYITYALNNFKDHPLKDPEELLKDLKKIRGAAFAVSRGDYIEGALGIGAPIFDMHGELVASMGIILPNSRGTEETTPQLKAAVSSCAQELSEMLGFSKDEPKRSV